MRHSSLLESSGKSSVMSLVQHLYEPSSGEVLIDGHKVRSFEWSCVVTGSFLTRVRCSQVHDLSPQWLSRNISVVSQEPTLFARSIRQNIMYGLEGTEYEPTDEEIREAARLANAASFIEVSMRFSVSCAGDHVDVSHCMYPFCFVEITT